MRTVAILANPASGKDIRRLVAHGSVSGNQEKVRLMRRLLLGLETAGVTRVLYMPEAYGIVPRALEILSLALDCEPIDMPVTNTQQDTTLAAGIAETLGVGVMVTLGGDGTSRAACKGSRAVPILPLSCGTNNVFPVMVEATVAGLAAGLLASELFPVEETCIRETMLEILLDNVPADLALVDVAVYDDVFTASRAVWDMDKVTRLFLSRCRADTIGLSSVGGQLTHIAPEEPRGLVLDLAADGETLVLAAIAPGRFAQVGIRQVTPMRLGEAYPISPAPCLLAVDGEREVVIARRERAAVRLTRDGPWVVDVRRVMELARRVGYFVRGHHA